MDQPNSWWLGVAPRATWPGYFTPIRGKAPSTAPDISEVARASKGRKTSSDPEYIENDDGDSVPSQTV